MSAKKPSPPTGGGFAYVFHGPSARCRQGLDGGGTGQRRLLRPVEAWMRPRKAVIRQFPHASLLRRCVQGVGEIGANEGQIVVHLDAPRGLVDAHDVVAPRSGDHGRDRLRRDAHGAAVNH